MVRTDSQPHSQQLAGLSFVVLFHILVTYAFLSGLSSNRSTDTPPPLLVRLATLEKTQRAELPPPKPVLKDAPTVHVGPPIVELKLQPPEPPSKHPGLIDGPPNGPSQIIDTGNLSRADTTGGTATAASVQGDCSNAASLASSMVYPARARRLGIRRGQVNVEFIVASSGVVAVEGVSATDPVFEDAALDAVRQLHCSAGRYRLPISFVLQE